MAATQQSGDEREADSQVLHWHLDPSPAAVGRMRHELDDALDQRGMSDDVHETLLLVAYELAANAVEHGSGPVEIVAAMSAGTARIEVHDGSLQAPKAQPRSLSALRGRGLQVVGGLADRWSWCASSDGNGKTVWAEIDTDRPPDRS